MKELHHLQMGCRFAGLVALVIYIYSANVITTATAAPKCGTPKGGPCPPVAVIDSPAQVTLLEGEATFTVSGTSSTGSELSYAWSIDPIPEFISHPDQPTTSVTVLSAGNYQITLTVIDSSNRSDDATMSLNVVEDSGEPPPPGEPDTSACNYPAFSDKPRNKWRDEAADFALRYQEELTGIGSNNIFWEIGSGTIKTLSSPANNWWVEDMSDDMHKVGNTVGSPPSYGITADGLVLEPGEEDFDGPDGKRWSAWYNNSTPLYQSADGLLKIGGKVVNALDKTRVPNEAEKLYTTWLSTWQRQLNDPGTHKSGSVAFKPPFHLKAKVRFNEMRTPGFRFSMWMLPVEVDATVIPAYDGDYSNGYEFDIFEFEPVSRLTDGTVCGNTLEFSWINTFGRRGDTGQNNFEGLEEGYCTDSANCTTFTYADPNGHMRDIQQGGSPTDPGPTHEFDFLWTDSVIAWGFNGEAVLEITDLDKIPVDAPHYLIVSREMTSGNTGEQSSISGGEYTSFLPAEGGLYGWNGNSNVRDYTDQIESDHAVIEEITIHGPISSKIQY